MTIWWGHGAVLVTGGIGLALAGEVVEGDVVAVMSGAVVGKGVVIVEETLATAGDVVDKQPEIEGMVAAAVGGPYVVTSESETATEEKHGATEETTSTVVVYGMDGLVVLMRLRRKSREVAYPLLGKVKTTVAFMGARVAKKNTCGGLRRKLMWCSG